LNRRYQRTATTITSAGNRNPANADFGGNQGRGRLDDFTAQACLDHANAQRNSAILNEALYTRIVEYVLLHLTDSTLTPKRIATERHISLRHLYRLRSHNDTGIAEWVIQERLPRAAAALTDDRQRRSPISAIAFSLAFSDAAHFSRRFRAAYGVPPHLWRQEFDR
jgi:AraC-like DNA-binding protein